MCDGELVRELQRITDAKCQLMADMTTALSIVSKPEAVVDVLASHTAIFHEFGETVEEPFMEQNRLQLQKLKPGSHLAADAAELERQHSAINDFISLLQCLKYDSPYTADYAIVAAVTGFEHSTAQIPKRATE